MEAQLEFRLNSSVDRQFYSSVHGSTLYVARLLLATPTSLATPSSFPTLQQDIPLKGGQAQALPMWQERECVKPISSDTQHSFHPIRESP